MDAMVIGIDVSKNRLDVAVRPTGESLIFKRTGAGIQDLIARLRALSPKMVAIEATGGFEAVVAAGSGRRRLAGGGRQSRGRCAPSPRRSANEPRPTQFDAAVIAHFAEATKPKLRRACQTR